MGTRGHFDSWGKIVLTQAPSARAGALEERRELPPGGIGGSLEKMQRHAFQQYRNPPSCKKKGLLS